MMQTNLSPFHSHYLHSTDQIQNSKKTDLEYCVSAVPRICYLNFRILCGCYPKNLLSKFFFVMNK